MGVGASGLAVDFQWELWLPAGARWLRLAATGQLFALIPGLGELVSHFSTFSAKL